MLGPMQRQRCPLTTRSMLAARPRLLSSTSCSLASRLAVIGCGKMAEAITGGVMRNGEMQAANVSVFDTNSHRMDLFQTRWEGVQAHPSAAAAVTDADVVLLAVKPQHMEGVLDDLAGSLSPSSMVVSIAAGCTIDMFTSRLPTPSIVRSMPNTPAMVGHGMTVWTSVDCSTSQVESARRLLSCCGDQLYVEDESYLDMATAIVGSGPAYTFMFLEAMADTGVHMGFPRETAEKLVLKTAEGSIAYLKQSDKHVAALRNDITSPGGTTAAAIYSSDRGGFRTTIADAIWAAYRRSLELGGKDSNVGPGRSLK